MFLDISAAFDSAGRNLIKLKCPAANIRFITSFLCSRQALISVNGELLNKQLNLSCPQGGILSPYLSLILINGILGIYLLLTAQIQAFADDTALSIISDSLTLPDVRGEGVAPIPQRFSSITFDRDKILK